MEEVLQKIMNRPSWAVTVIIGILSSSTVGLLVYTASHGK